MKKLDVSIWRLGNSIIGKVNHMDESLRGKCEQEYEGFYLGSNIFPEAFNDSLSIRGEDKVKDNRTFACSFSSEEYCDRWVSAMKHMINEVNSEIKEDSSDLVKVI